MKIFFFFIIFPPKIIYIFSNYVKSTKNQVYMTIVPESPILETTSQDENSVKNSQQKEEGNFFLLFKNDIFSHIFLFFSLFFSIFFHIFLNIS